MKWRIEPMGRIYDANESTVVYFEVRSGDTHLLSDFAAHVIQQLGQQSLTTDELVSQISLTMESGNLSDLRAAVEGVVGQLVTMDILQRA